MVSNSNLNHPTVNLEYTHEDFVSDSVHSEHFNGIPNLKEIESLNSNCNGDISFISQEDIEEASKHEIPYGALGDVVDSRTYLRWIPELDRRETFYERNARKVNYNFSLAASYLPEDELNEEAHRFYNRLNQLLVWGSGRTAWVGGTKASKLVSESTMNCSAAIVDRLDIFIEALHLLSLGCGFGFRVYPQDLLNLPLIKKQSLEFEVLDYKPLNPQFRLERTVFSEEDNNTILCKAGDSREGWMEALAGLLSVLFQDKTSKYIPHSLKEIPLDKVDKIVLDVNSVRPNGERIKGFGGLASGPEPLWQMLQEVISIVVNESGQDLKSNFKRLKPINALDIFCIIGELIRAGNTRRSSLICLFHPEDKEIREAKRGLWTNEGMSKKRYRAMSNNSISFDNGYKPSLEDIKGLMNEIRFTGEPGFVRADLHKKRRHEAALKWRKDEDPSNYTKQAGITNPCLTGDMNLLTSSGYKSFAELAGKEVNIVNSAGNIVSSKVWYSGNKEVVLIKLSNNKTLKSTPDHKWKTINGESEAKDLKGKKLKYYLTSPQYNPLYEIYNSLSYINPKYLGISNNDLDLLKSIQLDLETNFNIKGHIYTNDYKEPELNKIAFTYTLRIYDFDSLVNFFSNIKLKDSLLSDGLLRLIQSKTPIVEDVTYLDPQEVYDFSEPEFNWGVVEGFVCHNCGEINLSGGYKDLKAGSFCNLVVLPLSRFVYKDPDTNIAKLDYDLLEECLRLITRFALRQTLINISLKDWDTTQKKERLLGVDVCGWWEAFDKLDIDVNSEEANIIRRFCRRISNEEATNYAKHLGIERPLLVTAGKPNGCLTKEHLRVFHEGLLYIDEIADISDIGVLTLNNNQVLKEAYTHNKVNGAYNNGLSVTRTIKLFNGRTITGTLNHPLYIEGEGQTKLSDIEIGKTLETFNYKREGTLYPKQSGIKALLDKEKLFNSKAVDEEMAWLIGIYNAASVLDNTLFRADNKSAIKIYNKKIGYKLTSILEKRLDKTKRHYTYEVLPNLTIFSKSIYQCFVQNNLLSDFWSEANSLKEKDYDYRVPLLIRTSSPNVINSFLVGFIEYLNSYDFEDINLDSSNKINILNVDFNSLLQVFESIGLIPLIESSKSNLNKLIKVCEEFSNSESLTQFKKTFTTDISKGLIIRNLGEHPYTVIEVGENESDFTFDIEVEDSHYYYQGCIKSHNTYAQLPTVASGCHPPYAPYYIRRVRMARNDALAKTLIEQGVRFYPETSEWESYLRSHHPRSIKRSKDSTEISVWEMLDMFTPEYIPPSIKTLVFEIPIKTEAKLATKDISAITQLENYKNQIQHYIDHNQSITVTVGDDEWDEVSEWLFDNWEYIIGISFLPKYADDTYPLLPYQECTEEEFHKRVTQLKSYPLIVDKDRLNFFERELNAQNLDVDDRDLEADCHGGSCPVR